MPPGAGTSLVIKSTAKHLWGGILLEYESGLSSQEVGASFSIKLHTIEENPPGPPYGKVRPTEDRGLIQVEEHLEGACGEISNSIVHAPVLRVTPVQRKERTGFQASGRGMFILAHS